MTERKRASRRVRILRAVVLVIALAILVPLTLHGRLPSVASVVSSIQSADFGWLGLGALAQAASLTLFAAQQRLLLKAWGVRMRTGTAMAVTLARSAISISFPAGAAVSAAYAHRHYRRAGASPEIATATMVVSGLVSIAGLILLYVTATLGVLVQNPGAMLQSPLPVMVGVGIAIIALAMWTSRGRAAEPPATRDIAEPRSRFTAIMTAGWAALRDAWHAGGSLRARHWIGAVTFAAANWMTDLLCLAACTRALGMPIGLTTLAGIYLGVQIVRQVPITPGGVGLIETAYIGSLTAAGSTAATATAAVLLYRLLSCWLIIPAGGVAAIFLRREASKDEPEPARTTESDPVKPLASQPAPAQPAHAQPAHAQPAHAHAQPAAGQPVRTRVSGSASASAAS